MIKINYKDSQGFSLAIFLCKYTGNNYQQMISKDKIRKITGKKLTIKNLTITFSYIIYKKHSSVTFVPKR